MKKRTWMIGLAVVILCLLIMAIFLFWRKDNKVDKKEPMESTQEESEEEDLPIISMDGEEIILEEEEDEKPLTDTSESKKNQDEGSGDASGQEPEQNTEQNADQDRRGRGTWGRVRR